MVSSSNKTTTTCKAYELSDSCVYIGFGTFSKVHNTKHKYQFHPLIECSNRRPIMGCLFRNSVIFIACSCINLLFPNGFLCVPFSVRFVVLFDVLFAARRSVQICTKLYMLQIICINFNLSV